MNWTHFFFCKAFGRLLPLSCADGNEFDGDCWSWRAYFNIFQVCFQGHRHNFSILYYCIFCLICYHHHYSIAYYLIYVILWSLISAIAETSMKNVSQSFFLVSSRYKFLSYHTEFIISHDPIINSFLTLQYKNA